MKYLGWKWIKNRNWNLLLSCWREYCNIPLFIWCSRAAAGTAWKIQDSIYSLCHLVILVLFFAPFTSCHDHGFMFFSLNHFYRKCKWQILNSGRNFSYLISSCPSRFVTSRRSRPIYSFERLQVIFTKGKRKVDSRIRRHETKGDRKFCNLMRQCTSYLRDVWCCYQRSP